MAVPGSSIPRRPVAGTKRVLEIFSGKGGLTKAVASAGLPCEAWGFLDGANADLSKLEPRKRLRSLLRSGDFVFLLLLLP